MTTSGAGIADILYVRFRVADLDRQRDFLAEFGFAVTDHDGLLLARGTDPSPYVYIAEAGEPGFAGLGFEALSREDLERIAAMDGVPVEENPLPGGGALIRLTDPDGNLVEVVHGFDRPDPIEPPTRQPVNSGASRPRQGERVAISDAPVIVKRLGHCVLNATDFPSSDAWYKARFGFINSDEVFIGEERSIGAFMRVDRGELPVDHHTLFLVHAGEPGFNHAAFEVADWDALMVGHDRLQKQGYTHKWGVGKHLLGSQVFDYWQDPAGFTLEHFTDGDLFNAAWGSHRAPIEALLGVHWGPEGSP